MHTVPHPLEPYNVIKYDEIRITEQAPLTHLPLDKMAAILADDIFKCISLNENDRI